MFNLRSIGVTAATLCVFLPPAQASYFHYASDSVSSIQWGGSNVPVVGNVVYSGPVAYGGANFRRVEFSSDPVPYIRASAAAELANSTGYFTNAYGKMVYTFEVLAAPLAVVPLSFTGLFSFESLRVPSGGGNFVSFNVYPTANTIIDNNSSSTGMSAVFGSSSTDVSSGGTRGYTNVNWTGSLTQVSGSFTGGLTVVTDAFGRAYRTVELQAGVVANGSGVTGLATAYIDPRFEIDAGWLALNPSAALAITPGVGNQIAAVPEPGTAFTMFAGLIALWAAARRRSKAPYP